MWPFFEAKGSIISYSLKGKSMGELSGQFTVFIKYNLYPSKSTYVRQYFISIISINHFFFCKVDFFTLPEGKGRDR